MKQFRRTPLVTAAAVLALGVWGCSTGTGTTREEAREAAADAQKSDVADATARNDAKDPGTVQPDNTARNADPNYAANPPFDQGSSEADTTITQRIRQAVMDDQVLSTSAHNVKIITNAGRVVLMGPVMSEAERARIEQIAVGIAKQGNVQNMLEVKAEQPR
ncbi:MAG TPA: BON domain-containing protein [Candidatus Polarisedimenticolia bacterium]|nr:BON domain-containing protein [Candidatus Polarisedimenticolia bacterium]